jgi:hypothetical protein
MSPLILCPKDGPEIPASLPRTKCSGCGTVIVRDLHFTGTMVCPACCAVCCQVERAYGRPIPRIATRAAGLDALLDYLEPTGVLAS